MQTGLLGAGSVSTHAEGSRSVAQCPIDRRHPRFVSFALEAARQAIDEAGGLPDGRGAVVLATTHGGVGFSREFHETFASPLLFSGSVHNAAAFALSERFHVQGPVHTLLAGRTGAADAIDVAQGLLRDGLADWALAGASDEMDSAVIAGYAALGFTGSPAEGAAAFVLARHGRVLERFPRARVRCDGHEVDFSAIGEAFCVVEGLILAEAWRAKTAEVFTGAEWLPVFGPA